MVDDIVEDDCNFDLNIININDNYNISTTSDIDLEQFYEEDELVGENISTISEIDVKCNDTDNNICIIEVSTKSDIKLNTNEYNNSDIYTYLSTNSNANYNIASISSICKKSAMS